MQNEAEQGRQRFTRLKRAFQRAFAADRHLLGMSCADATSRAAA